MEVAVHPADDGSLTVDGAPRTSTSTSRPLLTVLAVVFTVVILAGAGVLAFTLVSGADPDGATTGSTQDDPATREAVMSQANQFVLRSNTYGPADLDESNLMPEYAEQVREVITPKFEVSFDSSLTFAEQTVAEAGYAREVELYATGVDTITDDSATVLVAGVFNGSYPDSSAEAEDGDRVEFEPQPFRFTVTLVPVDGEWLVDDFGPLSSEVVEPGTGGTGGEVEDLLEDPAATDGPTDAPTGAPTEAPTSGGAS